MVFAALLGAAACSSKPPAAAAGSAPVRRSVPVLPQPTLVESRGGAFTVAADTLILVPAGNADAQRIGELLSGYLQQVRGLKLAVNTGQGEAAAGPRLFSPSIRRPEGRATRAMNWKSRRRAYASLRGRLRASTTAQ